MRATSYCRRDNVAEASPQPQLRDYTEPFTDKYMAGIRFWINPSKLTHLFEPDLMRRFPSENLAQKLLKLSFG